MSSLRVAMVATCLLALAGCDDSSAPGNATTPPAATVVIPSTLFVPAPPTGAVPLVEAKESASAGDRVVFEARVGGRRVPFVENRAVFFVADPSLESCDQLPGDTCKYPWDYCCEAPDDLSKHMATVQVVDGAGEPLKISLENEQGLAALKTIFVTGTVQSDEAGNFVVLADTIHVKEG